MYDMYPEWGPAKHRPENRPEHRSHDTRTTFALQTSLDLRDNGGERPDDN